jgi:hypothetical protein
MIHFTGRRRKAGAITAATAAAVGALVLSQAGTTLATGSISRVPHPTTVTRTTVGTRLVDSASNNGQCDPSAQQPIVTGGVLLLPGSCANAQGVSVPPGQNEQQDQECQLTEAQQQEVITRAQDQQAAAEQAFQSTLLKNLLATAATKASAAALTVQMSGYTGLSPQDVPSLIQNGSVTPADMAAAILQTLQELGESSGDTAIDTCAGIQSDTGSAVPSNPWFSASDDSDTPNTDQQLAGAEQQFGQENWASLSPTELGKKIAATIINWASGKTNAICDLVTRANLSQHAAAEAANEAAQQFGGTGGIVQMGDSLVVPPSAGGDPAPSLAIAPDGTVTPAYVTRVWDQNAHDMVNTNLRPRN